MTGADTEITPPPLVNYVDVRDFAEAVYKSIQLGVEGRYVIRAGWYDHQKIADRMRELIPQEEAKGRIAVGNKGVWQSDIGPKNSMDASKATEELGMTCKLYSISPSYAALLATRFNSNVIEHRGFFLEDGLD